MSFIDIVVPSGFECGFQNTLDFESKKYCFKYEYADNGKRCIVAGDDKEMFIRWFMALPEKQRQMYEFIRENDVVCEFYDVDVRLDETCSEGQVEEMSDKCIVELLDARNEVAMQTISKKDIIVLSAHTPAKLSLHILSKRTYFRRNQLQHYFAEDVYRLLQQKGLFFNIDVSVYSKNRCFRMYLNHKYKKNNPLVLYKPHIYSYASFEDTWVVLTHRNLTERVEIRNYTEEDVYIRSKVNTNEELTRDLDELLQAFLQEHPYFEPSGHNRLNRIDQTRRPCLTDPTDHHSFENMYWYIQNHHLYVQCFCKKGEPICLGQRKGVYKIDMSPEPFLYATHSGKDFKTYDDFLPKQKVLTILDKRRTGCGKTTSAMNFISHFQRILLVHNRLTLDADYINKYPEFVSYKNGLNHPKQTVCFNSLSKIQVDSYDLIIIDEIRSVLKQTDMKDMVYSTHALFNILENMDIPVIMLDANMTNRDIEFIRKHRPDTQPIIIHDSVIVPEKKVYLVDAKAEMSLLKKINTDIQDGKKVVIIYNRSIRYINALLSPYYESKRVLHVNRTTRSSVSMNTEEWYDNYDIIAYSPTISEGVSITDQRFKDVQAYGLFKSNSCPAESASQMVARFRAIQHFTIHVDDSRCRNIPIFYHEKDIIAYLNRNISQLHQISEGHYNIQRQGGQLHIIEDEFCDLYCKNLLEHSLDYHNYRKTLIQKLVNNAYDVFEDTTYTIEEEEEKELKSHVKALKTREDERVYDKILHSKDLSPIEYNTLIEMGTKTEEEECCALRYNVLHTMHLASEHLTIPIIRRFHAPQQRHLMRNIRTCFSFIRNETGTVMRIPVDVLIQENSVQQLQSGEMKTNFLQQKQCVTSFTVVKMRWLNERLKELGFAYLYSPEGVDVDMFERNMERILAFFQDPQHYNEYVQAESNFGKYFNRKRQTELDEKFITAKLEGMFALRFGVDQDRGKVYQQCTLDIRLHDTTKEHPSVLGQIPLPEELIRSYDTMFMKNLVKRCEVCGLDVPNGMSFRHLSSKKHRQKTE